MEIKAPYKTSPLAHRAAIASETVALSESPFCGVITVRGQRDVLKIALAAGGLTMPGVAEFTESGTTRAHWIGPDTIHVTTLEEAREATLAGLQGAVIQRSGQVVDVSNYYTTICLSGVHARDILQKLSTLDFHPTAFSTGTVKATAIAQSNVLIAQVGEVDFTILIRASHADYFWCLLARAGREFGLPEQEVIAGETLRQ